LNSSGCYVYCCFWHVVVVLLISVLPVQKLVILFLFICIGSLSIDNCSLTINSFYTGNARVIQYFFMHLGEIIKNLIQLEMDNSPEFELELQNLDKLC
jgi:hypothetical protein